MTDAFFVLTEHKVLHCYATNAVWLKDIVLVWRIWRILFSRLSILLSYQPLSGNSLNSFCAPYCFDRYRFLIRITSSYEIFIILFNFC